MPGPARSLHAQHAEAERDALAHAPVTHASALLQGELPVRRGTAWCRPDRNPKSGRGRSDDNLARDDPGALALGQSQAVGSGRKPLRGFARGAVQSPEAAAAARSRRLHRRNRATRVHKPFATWNPARRGDGPRRLVFVASRDYLIVACTDHVRVFDAAHDAAPLGRRDTGAGADNIGLAAGTPQVFVAAGRAARLAIAHVGDGGALELVATVPTVEGARNVVADAGNAYAADPWGAACWLSGTPVRRRAFPGRPIRASRRS